MRHFVKLLAVSAAIGLLFFPRPSRAGEKEYTESYREQAGEWQDFKSKQFKEVLELQKELKETAPEARAVEIYEFERRQYEEEARFRAAMHGRRMEGLKRELESDLRLSEEKKRFILDHQDGIYARKAAFYDRLNQERAKFYREVTSNPALGDEEKREKTKAFNDSLFLERKDFFKEQEAARKEFQDKMRSY